MVEKRGEFAVRGGIARRLPPTADHPVRVEFFGDEITDIRTFGVIDQRSLAAVDVPSRAAVPGDPAHRRGARPGRRARPRARQQPDAGADAGQPGQRDQRRGDGVADPGPGRRGARTAADLVRDGTHVLLADPERIRTRAARPGPHRSRVPRGVLDGRGAPAATPRSTSAPSPTGAWRTCSMSPGRRAADLAAQPARHRRRDAEDDGVAGAGRARRSTSYRGDTGRRARRTPAARQSRPAVSTVLVVAGRRHRGSARRAAAEADMRPASSSTLTAAPEPGRRHRHLRPPENGFVLRTPGSAILTEADLTGTRGVDPGRAPAPAADRRRNAVDPVRSSPATTWCTRSTASASTSTWCSAPSGGATREYLVVEYAPSKRGHPGDRLFVPTDALDLLPATSAARCRR